MEFSYNPLISMFLMLPQWLQSALNCSWWFSAPIQSWDRNRSNQAQSEELPRDSTWYPFLSTQTIISLTYMRTSWSAVSCHLNIRFWDKPSVLLLQDTSRVMFGGGNRQLLVHPLIMKWTFHILSPFLINAHRSLQLTSQYPPWNHGRTYIF